MPQTMINEVTPIVVDGDYFNCNGGGDTLTGHPIEMIKVDSPWPAVCKYCGLRYISREHAHKSAEWAHLVGVRALPPPPMYCPPVCVLVHRQRVLGCRLALTLLLPRCHRRTRPRAKCTRGWRRIRLADPTPASGLAAWVACRSTRRRTSKQHGSCSHATGDARPR